MVETMFVPTRAASNHTWLAATIFSSYSHLDHKLHLFSLWLYLEPAGRIDTWLEKICQAQKEYYKSC